MLRRSRIACMLHLRSTQFTWQTRFVALLSCTFPPYFGGAQAPPLFRRIPATRSSEFARHRRASALAEQDHVGSAGARRLRRYDPAEEVRRDVPLPTVVGDDRHRLLVVARQQAFDLSLPRRPEGDPVTDPEFEHFRMRPHLVEEAEARDDAVVEVDELGVSQPVDINLHGSYGVGCWYRLSRTLVTQGGYHGRGGV